MRTTIRLPGDLLEMAKRKAAAEGRTLTDLITDAVRVELARRPARERIDIPVSSATGGPLPGVDLTKTSALEEEWDVERFLQKSDRATRERK